MINKYFIEKIRDNFPFSLTNDQETAINKIVDYIFNPSSESIFLLKGYAGTGKSTLIGTLVKTMAQFEQKTVLLAPTGRAAKVFSSHSDESAYTIHKKIYRQKGMSDDGASFSLMDNLYKNTLFIVDEASMISNRSSGGSLFGTGRLLDDLIEYVYSGANCKLLFLGDTAQLPPVKQDISPAMDAYELQTYGLDVIEITLREIVRQAERSGILYNATLLRNALSEGTTGLYPKLVLKDFTDVQRISGNDLIEEISSCYSRDGLEETIVISRANKSVNIYNNGIRNSVLYREEELSNGDLLMVTKNNYFWLKEEAKVDFIANGEFVEVTRIRTQREMYGMRFCDVVLYHKNYDIEFDAIINLDSLHSERAGDAYKQSNILYNALMEEYSHIGSNRDRYMKIKKNPYFNALQVKYGYAVTCHKAQGGEWRNVFIDLSYINPDHLGDNFYRWLYTSITRSTKMLYLVNLADEFLADPN
ncbi:MAG: AAA family ATPase [Bacteroidales bacterium]|nr:AAA family ATPase [Bacteroidales bacterium]